MKIPNGYKITGCAAKESGRYSMQFIALRLTGPLAGCLIATDGRMAMVLPVELEEDEQWPTSDRADKSILLPREAVDAATKLKLGKEGWASLRIEGGFAVVRSGNPHSPKEDRWPLDPNAGEFPRVEAVIPKDPKTIVGLNGNFLKAVVDALGPGDESGGRALGLSQADPKGPMILTRMGVGENPWFANESSKAEDRKPFALIMPVTVDG